MCILYNVYINYSLISMFRSIFVKHSNKTVAVQLQSKVMNTVKTVKSERVSFGD